MLGLLVISIILSACATMLKIDETFTSKNPDYNKTYTFSKSKCLENVKKSLKDLGTSVDQVIKDKVISDKWEIMRTAEATTSAYSYTSYAVQNVITAKIYVDVIEKEKATCTVTISKIRAWENTTEYEKIDIEQAKQKIAVPFFKNLDERMISEI